MSVWYLDCNSGKNGGNDGANVRMLTGAKNFKPKSFNYTGAILG